MEWATLYLSNGRRLVPVQVGRVGKKVAFRCGFDRGLVEEFKCMRGADFDRPSKTWLVTDCRRNWIQVESMREDEEKSQGGPVVLRTPREFERYGRPLLDLVPTRGEARAHQAQMLRFGASLRCCEWAAEQGTGKTLAAVELMEWASARGFPEWWYVAPLKVKKAVELELAKWKSAVRPRLIHYDVLYAAVEARFTCRSCGSEWNETRTWAKRREDVPVGLEADEEGVEGDPGLAPYSAVVRFPRCPQCRSSTELHESLWRRLPDRPAPHGVVFDESSFLKNGGSRRAVAAQHLADAIRAEHDGFVILMSGTPAPRDPTDWHSQVEIAAPGWLRESTRAHLTRRLAVIEEGQGEDGRAFPRVVGWKKDEVERLYGRLKPLVTIHFAKDCLELPELTKEVERLPVEEDVARAAATIAHSSINAVQALNRLRQLSDGFQYGESSPCASCDGHGHRRLEGRPGFEWDDFEEAECPRCGGTGFEATFGVTRCACPKDDQLRLDLGRNEETGRVVVYAGYRASIDRVVDVCAEEGWDVLRCDGRGWSAAGKDLPKDPSDLLAEMDPATRTDRELLAFVAHPGSGGFGLNLAAARENVFYSNDFNAASRWQAEKRSHRLGQTRNVRIVDYVHLPTDEMVLENLEKKRALQSVTLGEVLEWLP